jgi:hypothetical protein
MKEIRLSKKITQLAAELDNKSVVFAKDRLRDWMQSRRNDVNFPAELMPKLSKAYDDMCNVLDINTALTSNLTKLLEPIFLHRIVVKCADYMLVNRIEVADSWVNLHGPKVRLYENDGTIQLEVSVTDIPIQIRMFELKYERLDGLRIATEKEYLAKYTKYKKALVRNEQIAMNFANAIRGAK